jgi:hypothetical protein
MRQFLGDDNEEQLRKTELKSIVSATFYGWAFGSLVGAVLGGYGGFLVGMFVGSVALSLFSILGVRASRRQAGRQSSSRTTPKPSSSTGLRRR